jgi:hypothetical protein
VLLTFCFEAKKRSQGATPSDTSYARLKQKASSARN